MVGSWKVLLVEGRVSSYCGQLEGKMETPGTGQFDLQP